MPRRKTIRPIPSVIPPTIDPTTTPTARVTVEHAIRRGSIRDISPYIREGLIVEDSHIDLAETSGRFEMADFLRAMKRIAFETVVLTAEAEAAMRGAKRRAARTRL